MSMNQNEQVIINKMHINTMMLLIHSLEEKIAYLENESKNLKAQISASVASASVASAPADSAPVKVPEKTWKKKTFEIAPAPATEKHVSTVDITLLPGFEEKENFKGIVKTFLDEKKEERLQPCKDFLLYRATKNEFFLCLIWAIHNFMPNGFIANRLNKKYAKSCELATKFQEQLKSYPEWKAYFHTVKRENTDFIKLNRDNIYPINSLLEIE